MFDESRTVGLMISLYCRKRHGSSGGLCDNCSELLAYALERNRSCPLRPDKPVCSACTVHCYVPEKRERIKTVMRFAGPRMILHHPVTAVRYLLRKRSGGSGPSR